MEQIFAVDIRDISSNLLVKGSSEYSSLIQIQMITDLFPDTMFTLLPSTINTIPK
jgi:hypothetical protein